ncbi:MAG: hypothetical protein Q4D88_01705 [Anaerococcus sp.]|nr:hypothetical protein [Anaerococcus sp.]
MDKKKTRQNQGQQRKRLKRNKDQSQKKKINELKKRDRNFKMFFASIAFIVLIFVLGSCLAKEYNLNKKRDEYNSLQADILSRELTKDRLSEKLENAIDLPRIQRYALEELDMVYRDEENTVKLNVDRN